MEDDGDQETDADDNGHDNVLGRQQRKVVGRSQCRQGHTSLNSDEGVGEDSDEGAKVKDDGGDAQVRRSDVHEPVGDERRNAQEGEIKEELISLGLNLDGELLDPFLEILLDDGVADIPRDGVAAKGSKTGAKQDNDDASPELKQGASKN